MKLFIETLMVLLEKEGMTQTDLVARCNRNGKKDGVQISKGAVSNYKQGRFPEPAYAALIIRNISKDEAVRNELAIAYLHDVGGELGLEQGEVDIINLRKKKTNQLQSMPEHLRAQLTTLGQASLKIPEYRSLLENMAKLARRHLSDMGKRVSMRGVKAPRG